MTEQHPPSRNRLFISPSEIFDKVLKKKRLPSSLGRTVGATSREEDRSRLRGVSSSRERPEEALRPKETNAVKSAAGTLSVILIGTLVVVAVFNHRNEIQDATTGQAKATVGKPIQLLFSPKESNGQHAAGGGGYAPIGDDDGAGNDDTDSKKALSGKDRAEIRSKLDSAHGLMKSGEVDAAFDVYKSMLKKHSHDADIYSNAIEACLASKNYSLANKLYMKGLKKVSDPDGLSLIKAKLKLIQEAQTASEAKTKDILTAAAEYQRTLRDQAPKPSLNYTQQGHEQNSRTQTSPTNQLAAQPTQPQPGQPVPAQSAATQQPQNQPAVAAKHTPALTEDNYLPLPPASAPTQASQPQQSQLQQPAQAGYVQSYQWKK